MIGFIKRLKPTTLKYRLFLTFSLLILLPLSVLNIYSFQQVEGLIQKKISEQSLDQLKQLQGTLEELMGISYKSLLLLEQDETIKDILADPSKREPLANKHLMESRFKSIENSFFLITPQVYFTFLDFNGNAY